MIRMIDVHKRFGEVEALRGLDLEARDGEITGLLGPNGAGKTTALRCIYGLTQPTSGEVEVDDHRVSGDVLAVRSALGVFTDKFGLYDRLSAREQLAYFAELNGLDGAAQNEAIAAMVDLLGLEDLIDRRTEGFSQGQRMKVGLARALVHRPRNLVLDEPTRGLDVSSTRALRDLLRQLRAEGRCIVFSSHVMQEVAQLCDRVILIRDGARCAAGSPRELCDAAGKESFEEAFLHWIGTEEGVAA
ncbi:MAG: ATP-binding cassette domain-containing protein [Acidobacteriota bacterium]